MSEVDTLNTAHRPLLGLGSLLGIPVLIVAASFMDGCAPQNAVNQPQTLARGLVTDASSQITSTAPVAAATSSSVTNPVSATGSRFCPEGTGKYTTDSGIEEITFQGCDAQGRWAETIYNKANGTTVQVSTIFGIELFGYMYDQKKLVDGMTSVLSEQPSAKILEPVPAGALNINFSLMDEDDIEKADGHFHQKTYSLVARGVTPGGASISPVNGSDIYNFRISFLTRDNETGLILPTLVLSNISPAGNAWHEMPPKSLVNFSFPQTAAKSLRTTGLTP